MTVDDVLQFVAEHFEEPCNYTFGGVEVHDLIFEYDPDYCEKNCGQDIKECWRKYFECYMEDKR